MHRVEQPAGLVPVCDADHPAVKGLGGEWPAMLGYNRFAARTAGEVLATIGDDPLLVIGSAGTGRVAAFASDLAPIGRRRTSFAGAAIQSCGPS